LLKNFYLKIACENCACVRCVVEMSEHKIRTAAECQNAQTCKGLVTSTFIIHVAVKN